jgi:formate dehydrogenase major subunit
VDGETLSTPVEGVFAAGDAITGPASVAEAIGKGRHAAISMDCYLSGRRMGDIESIYINPHGEIVITDRAPGAKKGRSQHVVGYDEVMNPEYYEKQNRVAMGRLPLGESIGGFKEINNGYTREESVKESNRCFHCGHCSECGTCVDICPLDVLAMGSEGPEVVYPSECWHCGSCRINCPCGAVWYEFPLSMLL